MEIQQKLIPVGVSFDAYLLHGQPVWEMSKQYVKTFEEKEYKIRCCQVKHYVERLLLERKGLNNR